MSILKNIVGSRCQTTPSGRKIIIGRNSLDLVNGSESEWSADLRNFFQSVGDSYQPVTFVIKPNEVKTICIDNIDISNKYRTLWAFASYEMTAYEPDECLLWGWETVIESANLTNDGLRTNADIIYNFILNQSADATSVLQQQQSDELIAAESDKNGLIYIADQNRLNTIEAAEEEYQNSVYSNPSGIGAAISVRDGKILVANQTYNALVIQYTNEYNNSVVLINTNYTNLIVQSQATYQTQADNAKQSELDTLVDEGWKPFHKVLALSGTWNPETPTKIDFLLDPIEIKNPNTHNVTVKLIIAN
jgi:hypothetical protein